jgi:hypothetical protein
MIYEQRVYHCLPGKLPALLKRFEGTTLPLWERFGIRQAGFWTYEIGPSNQALVYLLAWENLADREAKWTAFQADPEWQKERAASEAAGPIVERIENAFLKPTSFSAVK